MPFAVIANGLDRHDGPQDTSLHPQRRAEESRQQKPGAAAKLAQQLTIVFEIATKNDGDAGDVLPMGDGIEDRLFQVLNCLLT